MALQLVCLRTLSSAQGSLRGNIMSPCSSSLLNVYGMTNTQDNLRINARYFRITGSRNKTPYDLTPQVRQNSASASLTMSHPLGGHVESKQNRLKSIADTNSKTEVLTEKLILQTLTSLTKTYDFLTLPVYSFVQQPWKKLHEHGKMKAILVDEKNNEWNCVLPPSNLHMELVKFKIDTLEKLFTHAIAKNGDKPCVGHRELISETEELDAQGKVLKKYELGEYQWKSYNEMNDLAEKLSKRFSLFNLKPKDKVAVFAETRAEWMMLAIACFKKNLSIATVFTTLGDSGVVHALNETEVTCLFTSEELMPRCNDILKDTPLIKNVVYMDKVKPKINPENIPVVNTDKISKDVKVQSLSSLLSTPESQESQTGQKPEPNDTSIIMYTSGSTGAPKGVIISHWNLVSALKAVSDSLACIGDPNDKDGYLAYLPLAHSMELMSEAMCFVQGIKIGYSSPLTLTDASPGIKNCRGDAIHLSPTILAAVPLVLERISKGVHAKIADKGKIASLLFDYFTKYKMGWIRKGYTTPLVDRIFFSKIRNQIGSNLRVVICGGAPLAPTTHELIRTILCCPVIQGYGLTETCASATMSLGTDLSIGRAGGPISSSRLRLIDWVEGGYKSTDKPFPRGELLIGGDNVAVGYFKKSDSTDFFLDVEGNKWFRSGDIVEVENDGAFKVIDRKKDLVKLSTAEFVSLGKIEAILKTSPYVENICVFADPYHPYPVAVMVASQVPIEKLAAQLEISKLNFSQLVKNPLIKEVVLSQIQKQARLLNLSNYEIPRKIHLDSTIWLPQSGLVTAALKIKRNNVYQEYKKEVEQMLQEVNAP